jgi:peptide/nickel transport system substrate-binding protein
MGPPMLSRRTLIGTTLAAAGLSRYPAAGGARAAETVVRGGRLIVGLPQEPEMLTSALTTSGTAQIVSGKIFDGLVYYDGRRQLQPQLATAWAVAPDGLSISFTLRPNVTWHDGQPFTAADVAYSVLEIWKKYHSRGRSTFANVVAVEAPDPLTVIWRLSKPAPYIMGALASFESQIVPKHLYDGTDVLTNPLNAAPIGTGPYRFLKWDRGSFIALERNPAYWDRPKPYLDMLIFRVVPDAAGRSTALETGEIDVGVTVGLDDIVRLAKEPALVLEPDGFGYIYQIGYLAFNLDRPVFQDIRVRRAFAHAIDRDFIVREIWRGYGRVGTGPLPSNFAPFYTPDVPDYPYDTGKAAQLLDEAGLRIGADGTRLSLTLDPLPAGDEYTRTAEYLRDALSKVGVKIVMRQQDWAGWLHRVYTERDFDLATTGGQVGPDPAIGCQRFYWSKGFQRGVAFSNTSHYASDAADRALEAAQVELDPARRIALYQEFQRVAETDLPMVPLASQLIPTVINRRVRQYKTSADIFLGNLADVYLDPAS